ncbi:uncharacterized protein LOC144358030 [Saccoglossus kowalevskii]
MFSALRRKGNLKFANTPPKNSDSSTMEESSPNESYRRISDGSLPNPGEVQTVAIPQGLVRRTTPIAPPQPAPRLRNAKQAPVSVYNNNPSNISGDESQILISEAIGLLQRSLSLEEEKTAALNRELDQLRAQNKQLKEQASSLEQQNALPNGGESSITAEENEKLKQYHHMLKQQCQQLQVAASKMAEENQDLKTRLTEMMSANTTTDSAERRAEVERTSIISNVVSSFWHLESRERTRTLKELNNGFQDELKDENQRVEFLCNSFMACFRTAKYLVMTLYDLLSSILNSPGNPPNALDTKDTSEVELPASMRREITSFLNENMNSCPLTEIEEGLYDWIEDDFSESFISKIKENDQFQRYVQVCCKVSWQLNIQFPPLDVSIDNRCYNSTEHQPDSTCDVTPNNGERIVRYVWPCLYETENGKLLKKGIVLLSEKE